MDIRQELDQTPPSFDSEPVPISSYQETKTVPITSYQDTEAAQIKDTELVPKVDTETVPMSSYQDTEPVRNQDTGPVHNQDTGPLPKEDSELVPISSYQNPEPVPIDSYQEKEDFWETGFNAEDADQNKDPSPVPKDPGNKKSSFQDNNNETGSITQEKSDLNQLPPILPVSTGQGLPYAPVDWPNQGDVWTWRVGKRVNAAGFHIDRFLILPPKLQKRGIQKSFASKPSLARYIQTEFPDADVDAFFASFSWKVPALFQPAAKVDAASLFEETTKVQHKEGAEKDENALKDEKEGNSRYSQRKRKPIQTLSYEPTQEKPKGTPRNAQKRRKDKSASTPPTEPSPTSRQKSRQSSRRSTRQRGSAVDLNFLDAEAEAVESQRQKKKNRKVDLEDEQISIPHIYVSPMNGVLAVSHSPVDVNPEEFDDYLNSLDNLLTLPPEEGQAQVSSLPGDTTSSVGEYELAEARMKLSSILKKDFPSLFFSNDVTDLANLATKLRKDPSLSAEEMVKLKLIEEIPSFSEVFQENKGVIDESDKFFSALELNKAKVVSLKCEYSELKDKLANLQMEVDSNSDAIRQIDEQIVQLQARRAELTSMIGYKNKEKLDLSYAQKMVANSIPKVVQEVQSANSRKPEWESKKENALKREAEILTKFAPLKGFYL